MYGIGVKDISSANYYSGIVRAYGGSIFSYYGYGADITFVGWSNGGWGVDKQYPAYYTQAHPTRAIMICGEGV